MFVSTLKVNMKVEEKAFRIKLVRMSGFTPLTGILEKRKGNYTKYSYNDLVKV